MNSFSYKPLMSRTLLTICFVALSLVSGAVADDDLRLVDAVEAKQWESVAEFVDEAAVRSTHPDGMTALHWAVMHQHEATVTALLAAGADANAETRYEVRPLALACTLGNAQIVQRLLDADAKPNVKSPGQVTPLMLAARTGNPDIIAALLKHGADVDETERRGQTALMWAAAQGNVAAVAALIDGGASLSDANKGGFTAIMFAAREGHIDVVETLLDEGVDVNGTMAPKNSGNRAPRKDTSALIMAVESAHFELAMKLVQRGADPNDQRCGVAPLHILSWVRKPNRGDSPDGDPSPRGSGNLTSLEFVRAIVAAGADVNMQLTQAGKSRKAVLSQKGATPMLMASKTADLALMQLLVELGADPLEGNVDGCTPVMAAAGIGVRAVDEEAGTQDEVILAIDYLVSQGADVNTVDKNKETAMHGAAYRNFPRVVACLAAHGAKPDTWNHKNKHGWTPTMIAEGNRPGSFKPSPPTVAALAAAMD